MWANIIAGGHATYGGSATWLPYSSSGVCTSLACPGVRGYGDLVASGVLKNGARDFPHIHAFFEAVPEGVGHFGMVGFVPNNTLCNHHSHGRANGVGALCTLRPSTNSILVYAWDATNASHPVIVSLPWIQPELDTELRLPDPQAQLSNSDGAGDWESTASGTPPGPPTEKNSAWARDSGSSASAESDSHMKSELRLGVGDNDDSPEIESRPPPGSLGLGASRSWTPSRKGPGSVGPGNRTPGETTRTRQTSSWSVAQCFDPVTGTFSRSIIIRDAQASIVCPTGAGIGGAPMLVNRRPGDRVRVSAAGTPADSESEGAALSKSSELESESASFSGPCARPSASDTGSATFRMTSSHDAPTTSPPSPTQGRSTAKSFDSESESPSGNTDRIVVLYRLRAVRRHRRRAPI